MKKETCGTFHAKCGTRDLTQVFGTVPRKAGRVVTLVWTHGRFNSDVENFVRVLSNHYGDEL
jgi:hypothetical protein